MPDSLDKRIEENIWCGESGMWIRTHEPDEAIGTIVRLCKENEPDWLWGVWNRVDGLQGNINFPSFSASEDDDEDAEVAPAKAVVAELLREGRRRKEIDTNLPEGDETPDDCLTHLVLVIRNAHQEITPGGTGFDRDMVQLLQLLFPLGQGYSIHVVLLSYPGIEIPPELHSEVDVIDHELPDYTERAEIIEEMYEDDEEVDRPEDKEFDTIVNSACALTRKQIGTVCAKSIMHHSKIDLAEVAKQKMRAINKSGVITLESPYARFHTVEYELPPKKEGEEGEKVKIPGVGGMQGLKDLCLDIAETGRSIRRRCKGILIAGVPGVGKSLVTVALANEVARTPLKINFEDLKSKWFGESGSRMAEMIRILDAMAPALGRIEEVEKLIRKSSDSHEASEGQKAQLLEWQTDPTSDTMIVYTANDVTLLPPEFIRSGRVDLVFFLDFPSREVKDAIWDIQQEVYGIAPSTEKPDDTWWTGADIMQCCKLADTITSFKRNLVRASRSVPRSAYRFRDEIEKWRTWADGNTLDAETGEIFYKEGKQKVSMAGVGKRAKRKVSKKKPNGGE